MSENVDIATKYEVVTETPSPFIKWVECSSMAGDTGVQSQVESNQRLKKL